MKSAEPAKKKSAAPPSMQPLDSVISESLAQFSQRTSLSQSTLYYMVKRQELRVAKFGRRTLVPRSEILRVLALLDGEVA